MVLRQCQNQTRRVWNIPDDRNARPQVPKNQSNCQLFGAYLPFLKWSFAKILKKNDFINFNQAHNIRDSKGNVRNGMVGLFYLKVCTVCLKLQNITRSYVKFTILTESIRSLNWNYTVFELNVYDPWSERNTLVIVFLRRFLSHLLLPLIRKW